MAKVEVEVSYEVGAEVYVLAERLIGGRIVVFPLGGTVQAIATVVGELEKGSRHEDYYVRCRKALLRVPRPGVFGTAAGAIQAGTDVNWDLLFEASEGAEVKGDDCGLGEDAVGTAEVAGEAGR